MSGEGQTVVDHAVAGAECYRLGGRPIWQLHGLFHELMLHEVGPELAHVFCAPLNDGGVEISWLAETQTSGALRPMTDLADQDRAAAIEALSNVMQALDNLRKKWSDLRDRDNRLMAHCLDRIAYVPAEECVFFNGAEVRVIQWAEHDRNQGDVPQPLLRRLVDAGTPAPAEPVRDAAPRSTRQALAVAQRRRQENDGRSGWATVTLLWNSDADLDLYALCPSGDEINYGNLEAGGGRLDIDMNAGGAVSMSPVENIYWQDRPPAGQYQIFVNNHTTRSEGEAPTPFMVTLDLCGQTASYRGAVHARESRVQVAVFDIGPDGAVSIQESSE